MSHVKEHRNDRADRFTAYVFVAGFVVMLFGCVAWAVSGRSQPAVRISITALWLMFAVLNGNAFYTGQFTLERRADIHTRAVTLHVLPFRDFLWGRIDGDRDISFVGGLL